MMNSIIKICIDPYRLFEFNKLEYEEMKTLVRDNFVSMVKSKKFEMGELSDYVVVKAFPHIHRGEICEVVKNVVNSASIYLPFNSTVAAMTMWNLSTLSKYFTIFPLSLDSMGNNVLFNLTELERLERRISSLPFGNVTIPTVMNEASKHDLADRNGGHKKNHVLKNIDYLCLKVLGCHHPDFDKELVSDEQKEFGMTVGGYYLPGDPNSSGNPIFNSTQKDDILKEVPKKKSKELSSIGEYIEMIFVLQTHGVLFFSLILLRFK